jgi:Undecaprenyl-phosphate galactose phosphotransferase WbaP
MSIPVFADTVRHYGRPARTTSSRSYDWQRLHAAAIDRSYIGRDRFAWLRTPAERASKRTFDFLVASLLLIALSPVLAIIAVLATLDGGPALFGHRRIGANGEPFVCWKFRTMVPNADEVLARTLAADPAARAEWDRDFKLKNDPRVTRIGRILRAASLDELPQLFNVLKGDMSLVGPRPIVRKEIARYGSAFHDYAGCRPGITGAWQVSGRNDIDYGSRVRLDQEYARNWSLKRDGRILLQTAVVVIQGRGAY